jgi:hypothetical protein
MKPFENTVVKTEKYCNFAAGKSYRSSSLPIAIGMLLGG